MVISLVLRPWCQQPSMPPDGPLAPIDINDGRQAPGLAAFESMVNSIAMYVLIGGLAAVVIGVGIAVVGPRLGFRHARGVGIGGVVGGIFLGAVVGLASILINFTYSVFSG